MFTTNKSSSSMSHLGNVITYVLPNEIKNSLHKTRQKYTNNIDFTQITDNLRAWIVLFSNNSTVNNIATFTHIS